MSAEILALLDPATPDTWPQGILAAADLREQRAKAATPGRWGAGNGTTIAAGLEQTSPGCITYDVKIAEVDDDRWESADNEIDAEEQAEADAEHIAAEANPAHALAAVRRWKKTAERHGPDAWAFYEGRAKCHAHRRPVYVEHCPDLTETADEARAYLGGAS